MLLQAMRECIAIQKQPKLSKKQARAGARVKNPLMPKQVKLMFEVKDPELKASHPRLFEPPHSTISEQIKVLRLAAKEAYSLFLASLPKDVTPTEREKVGVHPTIVPMKDETQELLTRAGLGPHGADALNMLEVVGRFITELTEVNEKSKVKADENKKKKARGFAKTQLTTAEKDAKRRKKLLGDNEIEDDDSSGDEDQGDTDSDDDDGSDDVDRSSGKKSSKPDEVKKTKTPTVTSPQDFYASLLGTGVSGLKRSLEQEQREVEVERRMEKVENGVQRSMDKIETLAAKVETVNGEIRSMNKDVARLEQKMETGISDIKRLLESKLG